MKSLSSEAIKIANQPAYPTEGGTIDKGPTFFQNCVATFAASIVGGRFGLSDHEIEGVVTVSKKLAMETCRQVAGNPAL